MYVQHAELIWYLSVKNVIMPKRAVPLLKYDHFAIKILVISSSHMLFFGGQMEFDSMSKRSEKGHALTRNRIQDQLVYKINVLTVELSRYSVDMS
jgi:hypothetical protein